MNNWVFWEVCSNDGALSRSWCTISMHGCGLFSVIIKSVIIMMRCVNLFWIGGGFFSGERLKKPKKWLSKWPPTQKKCENDHRISGQFRVFWNAHHLKIRHMASKGKICSLFLKFNPIEPHSGLCRNLPCGQSDVMRTSTPWNFVSSDFIFTSIDLTWSYPNS